MKLIKTFNAGEFCWVDLGTRRPAAAKKFYRGVFGWTVKDFPMGDGDAYSIFRVRGKEVCALYPAPGGRNKPAWRPYVVVKNVDAATKTAKAAGAAILTKPADTMEGGRFAAVRDPSGATVALWQPAKSAGLGITDAPGTVSWHDLSTPKINAASTFYAKVFGWKRVSTGVGGNAYHLFKLGRKNVGGMWPQPMKKLAPGWITHWEVADCAKAVAKAKRLGGRALMGATRVPGMGRFAVLTDPQGAAFGVIEFEG